MTHEKGLLGNRENWDGASLSKEGSGSSRRAGDLLEIEVVVVFLAPVTQPGKLCVRTLWKEGQRMMTGVSGTTLRCHACPSPSPVAVPSHWQTHLTSTLPMPVDLCR